MKKIILMFAICGSFVAMQAQAYKKSETEKSKTGVTTSTYKKTPQSEVTVPEKIKNAFNEAYSDVKVTWNKAGENFRAMFKSNESQPLETIVVYDKNAKVLLTEKELRSADAPLDITKYCEEHMSGKTCRVWEVDTKNGTRKYFVRNSDCETVWFDKNGSHLMGAETRTAYHQDLKHCK